MFAESVGLAVEADDDGSVQESVEHGGGDGGGRLTGGHGPK